MSRYIMPSQEAEIEVNKRNHAEKRIVILAIIIGTVVVMLGGFGIIYWIVRILEGICG